MRPSSAFPAGLPLSGLLTGCLLFTLFSAAPARADVPLPLYTGEHEAWTAQAEAVAAWAAAHAEQSGHHTGDDRFDGEWDLVACQMTVLGLGQIVRVYPDLRDHYAPAATTCMDWLLSPAAHRFGTEAWGHDGLDILLGGGPLAQDPRDAWLGYILLAWGMYRGAFDPAYGGERYGLAIEAMAHRLEAPIHTFRTYPGETYPTDQSLCAAAVGLADTISGEPRHEALLDDWAARWSVAAIDPGTGLLRQSISPRSGKPKDAPRGSGTALAVYALSFLRGADGHSHPLSVALYQASVSTLRDRQLGVEGMREYARGQEGGADIDSGPIILGIGMSATGFSLSGARIHQDYPTWAALYGTAHSFGLPTTRDGGVWYSTGGAVGNAILLAMLTAPPA